MAAFLADEDRLAAFADDVGGLWCRRVAVLKAAPDSFTFLRDFVQPKVPCIIENAIPSGVRGVARPLSLTLDEIIHRVGEDSELTVDVTPDGHGDCVRIVRDDNGENGKWGTCKMFVKPHERMMGIGRFRDLLRRCERCNCVANGDEGTGSGASGNLTEVDSNGHEVFPLRRQTDFIAEEYSDDERIAFGGVECPLVVYYSRQNDCLRTEGGKLFSSNIFPETFPFAEQAFGTGPPEAINLWIGNERSASSMHKDHYENLFYVCSGQKEFILCPPADIVFLHEGRFSSGTFRPIRDGEGRPSWAVVGDGNGDSGEDDSHESLDKRTKWIEPDIKKYMESEGGDDSEFPLLSGAHPISVLVSEGEMLYIPSLWYHRVGQTRETVGVNYWYDMKFDGPHYCYFNFLQNLRTAKSG